jgi:hypothetical protein
MIPLLAVAAAAACWLAPAAYAARPQVKVPHHVNFGNSHVASTGERFVTLTNRSNTSVTISPIGVSSETGSFLLDFANENCVGVTLAPGASCTYGILYRPIVAGRQVGASDIQFDTAGVVFIKLSGHAK